MSSKFVIDTCTLVFLASTDPVTPQQNRYHTGCARTMRADVYVLGLVPIADLALGEHQYLAELI